MSVIQLLHGTDHIIEVPDIHIGNPHNDYGMGFYCTRVDEMAILSMHGFTIDLISSSEEA